jgi:hypothetical protein
MNRFTITPLALLVVCGSLSACSQTTVCDDQLVPAIRVTVRDSLTGVFLGSASTVVALRHGTPVDTIQAPPTAVDADPVLVGFLPGTYDLTVTRVGYMTWTKQDVQVQATNGGCDPATVDLQANLVKLP